MFQLPRNIFQITPAPMCLAREGGGGHTSHQSPGLEPSGAIHQTSSIRKQQLLLVKTAVAEIMTNLIGVFIFEREDNAFSVLNAEQPVVSPIGHKLSTEEHVYIPRDTAATISRGLMTPSLVQALNRPFTGPLTGSSLLFPCSTSAKYCSNYGARFQSSV